MQINNQVDIEMLVNPPSGESTVILPEWLPNLIQAVGAFDPIRYLDKNSRSFRFATRFLPAEEAQTIAEVYAFCRFTDDLVDSDTLHSKLEIENRLESWVHLARLAYAGCKTGLPLLDKPIGRMRERGVPFNYVAQLVEGMKMDLNHHPYRSMTELKEYTYRVAGVIGQWLTELFGVHSAWALERAADLGHAMQITNILRDVGEDWNHGRCYLPLDILEKHGIQFSDLELFNTTRLPMPESYRFVIEEMIEESEKHYRLALHGISSLPHFFQKPVLVSALVYRAIHSALRANHYDNFKLRAHSGALKKLMIVLQAHWLLPALRFLFKTKGVNQYPQGIAYAQ